MKSGQERTIFGIEACAHVPTHSLYVQGLSMHKFS